MARAVVTSPSVRWACARINRRASVGWAAKAVSNAAQALLRAPRELWARLEPRVQRNVIAALEALQAQGHVLGLCTNKPLAPTHAVLDHLNLSRFFGAVVGGDSLPVRQPDPAPLQATLAALGANPHKTLYVGDSEVDAETAQRAGLPFLLFTEGYRKTPVEDLPHRAAFRDFADLAGLVARDLP